MAIAVSRSDALRVQYAAVDIKSLKAVGALPGVAILAVLGLNGPGAARLISYENGSKIAWQAPGSATPGNPVVVSAGGQFLLEDGATPDKAVRVQVTPAFLPSGPQAALVIVAEEFHDGLGDIVTSAEAAAGTIETWAVDLKNASTRGIHTIKLWLDAATVNMDISWDGLSWYTPTSEADANVLTLASLAAGASSTLYLRRTVSAGAKADPEVLNVIRASWLGL